MSIVKLIIFKIKIMNENIFFQFKKENILDELIKLFIIQGKWKVDKTNSDFFHVYQWPDIILADRRNFLENQKLSLDKNAIELLGSYSKRGDNIGEVTIYKPAILDCINDFLIFKGVISHSFDEKKKYIRILTEIILIHEFVHWLVDFGESPELTQKWTKTQEAGFRLGLIPERNYVSKLPIFKYDCYDSISYHETISQIFTNYYCNLIGGEHWIIFDWLQSIQPSQYTDYKKILPVKIENEHLDLVFDILNFTREIGIQSNETLIILAKDYSKDDKSNNCYNFFDKLIKAGKIDEKSIKLWELKNPDVIKDNKSRIAGKRIGL